MPRRTALTIRELSVLSLIAEGQSYGYALAPLLKGKPGWDTPNLSSVYTCLDRLERLGHLVSRFQDNPDGPKRKHYFIKRKCGSRHNFREEAIRAGEAELETLLASYHKCRSVLDQIRREYATASSGHRRYPISRTYTRQRAAS